MQSLKIKFIITDKYNFYKIQNGFNFFFKQYYTGNHSQHYNFCNNCKNIMRLFISHHAVEIDQRTLLGVTIFRNVAMLLSEM